MKEQFVPYEIALKLKEKGFDEPCLGYFDPLYKKLVIWENGSTNSTSNWVYAPLWQQVSKWFRIVHNIYLIEQVTIDSRGDIFYYRVVKKGKVYSHSEPSEDSSKALEYAIQHTLTLI
jgi:hypothetical protein